MPRAPLVSLTTAPGSLAGLAERLRADGLEVREAPLLTFAPPADWGPIDAALLRLSTYRAVAVTSPRAAQVLATRAATLRIGPPPGLVAWAVGAATAAPLRDLFDRVELPSSLVTLDAGAGSLLAGAMLKAQVGSPVLFVCGETRRDELPAALRAAGITMDEIVGYRTVLADAGQAREAAAGADVLLVGSPRVASLLARTLARDDRPALVAIGPTTAAAARANGWAPDAVAQRPTVDAVAARIRALAQAR